MRDKFIRTPSPLSLTVIGGFMPVSLIMTGTAVHILLARRDFYTVAFTVIAGLAFILSLFVFRSVMKNGIRFGESEMEFTGLDENNLYRYEDIEKAEFYKDTKASLKKNLVERYSSIILYLRDGTVATVELGLTSKRKNKIIEAELTKRIG